MTSSRSSHKQQNTSLSFNAWLSHHPFFYALIGGTGVVLFWRGIWHTMDFLMSYLQPLTTAHTSIDINAGMWRDGPHSLLLGTMILICTKAFVSSLIGNEIIIAGLQEERGFTKKVGKTTQSENRELRTIRQDLGTIITRLDALEHRHVTSLRKK